MAISPRKPRIRKKPLTKREQMELSKKHNQEESEPSKKKSLKKAAGHVKRPIVGAKKAAKQEFFLPLPSGRFWDFMNKRRSLMPSYIVNSWKELKLVTWPTRRETIRMTMAVFIFSLAFGSVVTVVDKGVEAVIKNLILK